MAWTAGRALTTVVSSGAPGGTGRGLLGWPHARTRRRRGRLHRQRSHCRPARGGSRGDRPRRPVHRPRRRRPRRRPVRAGAPAGGAGGTVPGARSPGRADAVPGGARFVQARLQESAPVLADVRPEAVLHFAAKSLVGESQQRPELYWEHNVGGSLALLEAMRAADCRRIVFSSTAATYGEPEQVPIREDATTKPTNTYGATKLAVDAMLTSYATSYVFAAVSVRCFNVAGAAHGLGERHTTETHLIPIALQVAAGTRASMTIDGEDYPTPDGTCIRDYIHVSDLADAHLLALTAPEPGEHRGYNLGKGTGFSVQAGA